MPWTSSKSILTPQLRLIKQYNCPATFPKHWTETTILIYDWLEVALGSQSQGLSVCQAWECRSKVLQQTCSPCSHLAEKYKVNIFVPGKLGCSCASQNETETPLCSSVQTALVNVTLLLTVFMKSSQTDKKFIDEVAKVELQTLQISQRCGFQLFVYILRNTMFQKENILISLLTNTLQKKCIKTKCL